MADIIIVDPVKLRDTISQFENCKNKVTKDISELENNISEIAQAWKDEQASNTYQQKMRQLVQNVTAARDKLQRNIQELEEYTQKSESTISAAQSKAESLNSNFLEY